MTQSIRTIGRPRALPYPTAAGLLAIIFAIWAARVHGESTWTPLGAYGAVWATDVSADGSVVVGRGVNNDGSRVFRWSAEEIMFGPVTEGNSPSVSADGNVVVDGFLSENGSEAYRWTADGILEGLGDLSGGSFFSAAGDVSADGRVIVGVSISQNDGEAFRWTPETGMVGLGGLPGQPVRSSASGVSADGSIIVGAAYDASNRPQPFRWTPETGIVALGLLPGAGTGSARRVSADGLIIIGTNTFPPPPGSLHPQTEAFRWTEQEGTIGLGDLPGERIMSEAHDVSADGSVIVGVGEMLVDGVTRETAFYWSMQTGMISMRDLLISAGVTNLNDWWLDAATGVSWDGLTIVGTGVHPGGREAWVATIPEPSAIVLAVLAAAGLLGFGIRKRRGKVVSEGRMVTTDDAPLSSRRELLRNVFATMAGVGLAYWARRAKPGEMPPPTQRHAHLVNTAGVVRLPPGRTYAIGATIKIGFGAPISLV